MRGLVAALLAAATLAAAVAPAGAAEQELGPLCRNIAAGMGLDPALVSTFIDSVPVAPSSNFCPWLNGNLTQTQACDYLTLLYFGLTRGGSGDAVECEGPGVMEWQEEPVGTLSDLVDRRPLPAEFADPSAVFAEEGESYFWLYRQGYNAHMYAPCAGDPSFSLVMPPGWRVEALANLTQAEGPAIPLLLVLVNEEANQVVFLVRPTLGAYEWQLDFMFNHTDDPELVALFGADTQISHGFSRIFKEIWPTWQATLDRLVVNDTTPPSVFVTGHSMGAAVGMLGAYATQEHLNAKLGADKAPVVDAVFFSPPQIGDDAFVAKYNKLVNSRDISFSEDVVTQVPCAPSMPACPAKPSGLLGTLGVTGMPTDQGNVTKLAYGTIGGVLLFSSSGMPQDTATWSQINSMPLCWATTYLTAVHTCSYLCYLSQFTPNGTVPNDLCWLSPQPDGAPGSQCFGFPNGWLTPNASADGGAAPGPSPAPTTNGGTAPTPAPAPPSAALPLAVASPLAAMLAAAAAAVLAMM